MANPSPSFDNSPVVAFAGQGRAAEEQHQSK